MPVSTLIACSVACVLLVLALVLGTTALALLAVLGAFVEGARGRRTRRSDDTWWWA